MEKFLKILRIMKDYALVIIIAVLLIILHFKNNKIDNLTAKLDEKPKVEYVYNTKVDTFKIFVPKPKEIIKYKPGKDSITYVPIDLTKADSAAIAEAYLKISGLYSETKIYDDIIKNDSTAYIRLQEKVQFNSIKDRNIIFEDKTPVVRVTEKQYIYTTSIVGGVEAGTGGVEVSAGLITKKNTFYKVSYDPYNKTISGGAYFGIFNFKHK